MRAALILACGFVSLFGTLHAQQAIEAAPETPIIPLGPPPPPDPKVIKQLEAILTQKFTRDPNDIFNGLERGRSAEAQNLTESFLALFRTGDWRKIRESLAEMPLELARRIYEKMLADLTEKQKPNVRLDDVLALADAVPGEFTGDQLRRLGQLLGLAVPVSESYWLSDRLKKGTDKLGGSDLGKRVLAGRVLLAGGFKDLARIYLPPLEQLDQIADEGVRNEVRSFLSSQQESEVAQRGQVQKVWDDNVRILGLAKVNDWERTKASQELARVITQISPSTLAPVFGDMVKNNPEGAVRLISALGRKLQNEVRNEVPVRVENLKAQTAVANLLAENVDLSLQPWNQLSQMMGEFWLLEAETTFTLKTGVPANPNDKPKFVAPEELLATAPAGKWASSFPLGLRDRLDVGISRTILAGANFDQAAERIVEIGKRAPEAGVALAEDFLNVWARTHNPQIPETLRRKYELSDDARIPVTPIMMEKNIESLSRMMALFRQAGIAPKDYEKVVTAFDLAYSNAEAYRASHIETVFGPLDKMDEPLFFLILSRMNGNLGERWRKMDVQKAGLTRRDETQTLEMVRAGYGAALGMIESWLGGHADGSRALTLAGTLLTDWGDFEYFQELVTGDSRKRMIGYKEKNLQAQEYFKRGAEAYAKEVPKLAPADYSIDAYLGWFHGLLGIGSGGQLNLSKAMNRAALTQIRDHLLALPGKAAQAHLSQFAKVVNARLADEKEPLHEDLKYRYLASALVITKDDPFTLGAEKKVAYFDELLSEIRLQTRVDGPNTVGRDQEFGIIVSVIHTEAMGRVAQFGQYLTNAPGGPAGKPRKKVPLARKMREAQGPRDELELSLTETLAPFFEIKSITFAAPEVKPRPSAQPGWEETVLAYLLVKPKDASVDKIPPVEMELKFMDLTGPVTIPAESAETVIKVAAGEPAPRPAGHIEITQTLDTRQFQINGALPLEIKATATGLVPDLDQLLDLEALRKAIGVRHINPHEGLQVKEINTWGDQVAPQSERLWTIALDGDPIRAADAPTEFVFPAPKSKDAVVVYQSYNDMDLSTLSQPSLAVGRSAVAGNAKPASHRNLWLGIGTSCVLLGSVLAFGLKRRPGAEEQPVQARDVFKMPGELDGFAVVALLRRLRTSPLVTLQDSQKQELQLDLQRVQEACFGAKESALSEADLRGVVEKWLRLAC
ncbi:MAG: hypothetical protein JWL90_660 [Chthoniobacteraceae bacterium]|nr:hypothetical protein [Chthoniobacteraceae bacterium]